MIKKIEITESPNTFLNNQFDDPVIMLAKKINEIIDWLDLS